MTENQKLWLRELALEYRRTASNERDLSERASDAMIKKMHKDNAKELSEFADLLETLKEDNYGRNGNS